MATRRRRRPRRSPDPVMEALHDEAAYREHPDGSRPYVSHSGGRASEILYWRRFGRDGAFRTREKTWVWLFILVPFVTAVLCGAANEFDWFDFP